jgi:hypothetical protein
VNRCVGDIGNMDGQLSCNGGGRDYGWRDRSYRQSPGYGYDRYGGPGYGSSGGYWPPPSYPSDLRPITGPKALAGDARYAGLPAMANSEDLNLISSPTVAAAYSAHWRQRLAVSVRFARREGLVPGLVGGWRSSGVRSEEIIPCRAMLASIERIRRNII